MNIRMIFEQGWESYAENHPDTFSKAELTVSENRFWQMIEDARRDGNTIEALRIALRALNGDEIIAFENILNQKIAEAGTFPVLAANFAIQSYVSDDVFRDFRAWLVSQGQERFVNAVNDPETIADWLEKDDVDGIDGNAMLMLPLDAYGAHGDDEEFYDSVTFVTDPDFEQAWPESKSEYRQRFPRLVDKFWNQERIRELHPD